MTTLANSLRYIGFLTIALTLALVANFAYGQWANPTAAPTGGNVSPPITTSGVTQTKAGNFGAINTFAAGVSEAGSQMWSPWYCDENGPGADTIAGTADDDCLDVGTITASGPQLPTPPTCTGNDALQWDGSSWSCQTGVFVTESSCPAGPVTNALGFGSHNMPAGYHAETHTIVNTDAFRTMYYQYKCNDGTWESHLVSRIANGGGP